MSKNKKKPGKIQEKIKLKLEWEEQLDGGDFILKLQEAYSELISKGCSKTQVEARSSYDDCVLEIIFSGTRELTQEEIEKEEAKKQEEKKLVEQISELRRKLAGIKKS